MQDGGLDDGNSNALIEYTIVKSGTIYTITDPNGATVFQGYAQTSRRLAERVSVQAGRHRLGVL